MQTRVNLRILSPNVPLMNNSPSEQNHLDNNLGGEKGWELQCVSKFSRGKNPFLSLQNNKVFGSTVMWRIALESDNLLLFWKHTFKSGLRETLAAAAFLIKSVP